MLINSHLILVSGGFAIVQPGSQLSINAVEGFPLEDFSSDVSLLITSEPDMANQTFFPECPIADC